MKGLHFCRLFYANAKKTNAEYPTKRNNPSNLLNSNFFPTNTSGINIKANPNIQKISPFQAIQLADTFRKLSGKSGSVFDPLYSLQTLTGLDDIYIESIGSEGVTVGAGKYISDNVYLKVEQGAEVGSSEASVEVELTPNIFLESKANQNDDNDIGIFWEWEF